MLKMFKPVIFFHTDFSSEEGLPSPLSNSPGIRIVKTKQTPRKTTRMISILLSKMSGPRMEIQSLHVIKPSNNDEADLQDNCSLAPRPSRSVKVDKAFAMIDSDGDGQISCDQLLEFVCDCQRVTDNRVQAKNQAYESYLRLLFSGKTQASWNIVDFRYFMSRTDHIGI